MLTGQILLQLIVILLATQIFGHVCKRVGQQWVIGEILAGLALGPSLLGVIFPQGETFIFPTSALPTLQTLGDIGLILYLFSLGASLDIHLMLRQNHKAAVVSISGILLPLTMGMALAFFLFTSLAGPRAHFIPFMLIVGVAMAITAFPVLARFLAEKGLLATELGTLALTCAAIDDVVAWCLLALTVATAQAKALASVVFIVGYVLLFVASMFFILRPLLASIDRRLRSNRVMLTLSIILLLSSAYITNAIGIHPIFGAFIMGIILPRTARLREFVHILNRVNVICFLPLYFVYSGLHTQVGLIRTPALWLICLLVLAVACTGKICGGTFSMRFIKESWRDALSLGILMNTRGLVELIILNIGLEMGILSPTLFAMLVIMAITTTMMAAPLLWLQGRKQEVPSEIGNGTFENNPLPQEKVF